MKETGRRLIVYKDKEKKEIDYSGILYKKNKESCLVGKIGGKLILVPISHIEFTDSIYVGLEDLLNSQKEKMI